MYILDSSSNNPNRAIDIITSARGVFYFALIISIIEFIPTLYVLVKAAQNKLHLLTLICGLLLVPTVLLVLNDEVIYVFAENKLNDKYKGGLLIMYSLFGLISYGSMMISRWLFCMRYYALNIKLKYLNDNCQCKIALKKALSYRDLGTGLIVIIAILYCVFCSL